MFQNIKCSAFSDEYGFTLEYSVTRDSDGGYSISAVKKAGNGTVESGTVNSLIVPEDEIVRMAELLCANKVTPATLFDVVSDMMREPLFA